MPDSDIQWVSIWWGKKNCYRTCSTWSRYEIRQCKQAQTWGGFLAEPPDIRLTIEDITALSGPFFTSTHVSAALSHNNPAEFLSLRGNDAVQESHVTGSHLYVMQLLELTPSISRTVWTRTRPWGCTLHTQRRPSCTTGTDQSTCNGQISLNGRYQTHFHIDYSI